MKYEFSCLETSEYPILGGMAVVSSVIQIKQHRLSPSPCLTVKTEQTQRQMRDVSITFTHLQCVHITNQ